MGLMKPRTALYLRKINFQYTNVVLLLGAGAVLAQAQLIVCELNKDA